MSATQPTVAANATAIRAFMGWAPVRETPSREGLADAESLPLRLRTQGGQNRSRGVEFLPAVGPALERLRIATPELHVPVLVDVGRSPGLIRREAAFGKRQREQRRAGQSGHDMERAEPPRTGDVLAH